MLENALVAGICSMGVNALLHDPSPLVPISYGQIFSKRGGRMIYVIDRAAAGGVLDNREAISTLGIELEDMSG